MAGLLFLWDSTALNCKLRGEGDHVSISTWCRARAQSPSDMLHGPQEEERQSGSLEDSPAHIQTRELHQSKPRDKDLPVARSGILNLVVQRKRTGWKLDQCLSSDAFQPLRYVKAL